MKPTDLKRQILQRRGVTLTKIRRRGRKVKSFIPIHDPVPERLKTPLMRYLEEKHHQPIEVILASGSLSEIEKRYKVDATTASKWIKKLHLRWGEDNLPGCGDCQYAVWQCLVGICWRLQQAGLIHLLAVKARTIPVESVAVRLKEKAGV